MVHGGLHREVAVCGGSQGLHAALPSPRLVIAPPPPPRPDARCVLAGLRDGMGTECSGMAAIVAPLEGRGGPPVAWLGQRATPSPTSSAENETW